MNDSILSNVLKLWSLNNLVSESLVKAGYPETIVADAARRIRLEIHRYEVLCDMDLISSCHEN